MLPPFQIVRRVRPVDLVAPGSDLSCPVAPYVAIEGAVTGAGPVELALVSGDVSLVGKYDGQRLGLRVTADGTTTTHRSRRHGRPQGAVEAVALTLTATHLVVWARDVGGGTWRVRGRVDLHQRVDTHDEAWLTGLTTWTTGPVAEVHEGAFGQLGLRDLRLVTHADGTPYREEDGVLLTASSAGPGHFATGHTSVWHLDPDNLALTHRADLFFRRPGRRGVYGDHASHLLRDGDTWLIATSTWGDFDRHRDRERATVAVTLAQSDADLTTGTHVLDTRPLLLPTTGLRSVAVWDPHLVRTPDGWLVGYVNATRFFRFHPVVAEGPDLNSLTLRAATDRRATEGTTLAHLDGAWRVLASDGRDGRRGQRERYPVFDLDLTETATLDAPYPTNLPWPTLLEHDDRWLMVGFNGARYGGPLVGYGGHGAVVFSRTS